ncbi:Hypp2164 [Branchiostoma lanceolatum]|uniref:Hypp2164 protein n=1 Tax=Branchiostoma lanceolatum TaxID=7740 RepID=A0A8J9ZQN2_BRALA|nr:Hypp2164 [Branchiostoma lanceolatum]
MLLLEKISLVTILGLCILSLHVDGREIERGCSEENIKKKYSNFVKILDKAYNVWRFVKLVSIKVDTQVAREDRADSSLLLPNVGDLLFQDGRVFSGLRLREVKLTDLGLGEIEKFQIYMAEMGALLNELNRVGETVVDDVIETLSHVTEDKLSVLKYLKNHLPILQDDLKEVHEDASELVATRTRRDTYTQEHSASSSILLRKIRSLVDSQEPGAGERILQHSQWVLQDLQNLLQHDVISTLDSMANRRGKGGRGMGREEGGKRSD